MVTNDGGGRDSARDNATSAAHHLVLNQNVAMWSFCAFVIFVANLRVPVNQSEGSTKTHKFAAKITNL